MSHYSVCVAIPASRLEGGEMSAWRIESILDEILAPYDEGPVSEEYLEFQDKTEECREGYHKDTRTAVRFPDGSVHSAFAKEVTRRFVLREGKLLHVRQCGYQVPRRHRRSGQRPPPVLRHLRVLRGEP